MEFYNKTIEYTVKTLNSNLDYGLDSNAVTQSKTKNGANVMSGKNKRSLLFKIFDSLKEPMLLILLFAFMIAFGTDFGQWLKTGDANFSECIGILGAIILSVSITLIMEGSSKKAFDALGRIYDNVVVKVVRGGKVKLISRQDVVVGDIIIIESGDKIVADGRLVDSNSLRIDESALTGESAWSQKDYTSILDSNTVLAERKNSVFSGTLVTEGSGKFIVTAVGDQTEIGEIAGALSEISSTDTPLQQKLSKLGKLITLIGVIFAIIVFCLSFVKLIVSNSLSFNSIQELFISCIVLIVAAVPEGLPTIVAVSLALNMIKLAKENALIRKMTATETAGAVSVICTDKTGTLTENKMSVVSICASDFCVSPEKLSREIMGQNFICNSTADLVYKGKEQVIKGNATECALIKAFNKANPKLNYNEYRQRFSIVERELFSSDKKFMSTTIKLENFNRKLIKGAPEIILEKCLLSQEQKNKILTKMKFYQQKAQRILCFAHADIKESLPEKYIYDGFVSIADPIRKEVFNAVADCKKAGIKVKILTGDNLQTAYAIAQELGIAKDQSSVVNASYIQNLTDQQLKIVLSKITVIARSTPSVKLRIVKILKSMGEVVAVTGDGINDAPAIKHADVGIAMGINGSEITKEAADVVLLDDSFSTVVKAISFGRNVYRNLQRFILFQLSVNMSALLFITLCAILGLPSPFNTLQLLWINVIMDGPPAITLGLENASQKLMSVKPIQRNKSIVTLKMFVRILFNSLFIGSVVTLQHLFNFLDVQQIERVSVTFSIFILFQLFNAFNCRELGAESIFKQLGKNKIMVVTFLIVFMLHFIIVQYFYSIFSIFPMSLLSWIKTIALTFSVVFVSELYKCIFRLTKKRLK